MRSRLHRAVALAALVAAGCSNSITVGDLPSLAITPAALSFGNRTAGAQASQAITLLNTGEVEVIDIALAISGDARGAFAIGAAPVSLAAGASATVEITYTAPALTGADAATLAVTSNADPGTVSLAGQSVAVCVPEGDAAFCSSQAAGCGPVSGTDNCGAARTADCGACTAPQVCGQANTCVTPDATVLATLPSGASPLALAANDSDVYVTTANEVYSVPVSGGAPISFAPIAGGHGDLGSYGLALDSSSLYFTDYGAGLLNRVTLASPYTLSQVVSFPYNSYYAKSVAVGGDNLYWGGYESGQVEAAPLAGGTFTELFNAHSTYNTISLATDFEQRLLGEFSPAVQWSQSRRNLSTAARRDQQRRHRDARYRPPWTRWNHHRGRLRLLVGRHRQQHQRGRDWRHERRDRGQLQRRARAASPPTAPRCTGSI